MHSITSVVEQQWPGPPGRIWCQQGNLRIIPRISGLRRGIVTQPAQLHGKEYSCPALIFRRKNVLTSLVEIINKKKKVVALFKRSQQSEVVRTLETFVI